MSYVSEAAAVSTELLSLFFDLSRLFLCKRFVFNGKIDAETQKEEKYFMNL